MIIKRLKLDNFRQFYGEQFIEFAVDKDKNITLIHAENGVGKTAILNSILWCMFEETTKNFEQENVLLNYEAKGEGKTHYGVTLEFEQEGKEYSVCRTGDLQNRKAFRVYEITEGNYKEHPSPMAFINSVIPKEMAHYFFFQGEGIGTIASNVNSGIRNAIRDILGFSLAELAIADLDEYHRRIEKEASTLSVSDDLKEWNTRREVLHNIKINHEEKFKESERLAELSQAKAEEIEKQLRTMPDAAQIQLSRDNLERDQQNARHELNEAKLHELDLIQRYGFAIFGKKMASTSLEFIDESTLQGKIPSPYNEQLVKDLLKRKSCICNRPLQAGSPEFAAIAELLKTAGNADLNSKILKARAAIRTIEDKFLDSKMAFKVASSQISQSNARLAKIEAELKECSEKLKGIKVEEIKTKEVALSNLKATLNAENRKQGELTRNISENTKDIESLDSKIKNAMAQQPKLKVLKEKADFIEELSNLTKNELNRHEADTKNFLVGHINDTLEKFSRKDYKVHLDHDFNLTLRRSDGGIVAKSDGERLLLSLAFIATLIWFAERRAGASGNILVGGAVAPFVIDAPFGELDESYKAATASLLPERARQIVLLLSTSHWKGTVDHAIRSKVGTEYILRSERKSDIAGSKPLDKIELDGQVYEQSLYGAAKDMTRAIKV